jgi:UPF0755 protein
MYFRIVGFLTLIVAVAAAVLVRDVREFARSPLNIGASGLHLVVEPGENINRLSRELAARDVLERPVYLRWLARWRGDAHRIQAGEYTIAPGTTPEGLLALLVSGKVIQRAFTLVEGWTFTQVRDALSGADTLVHDTAELSDAEVMQLLGYPGQHPEGRFLPDTYYYTRGSSDLELLQRAHAAMQSTLDTEWPNRTAGLPLATPHQALILASIVEKETGLASERAEIAGVFVRRLRKDMLLQTDPTVIYGMGDHYKGNIRKRDLIEDTPYNTYVHKGLPPTPICMPGREAIRAVLHPADGKALYFVGRGDGSHQFSETLREHNRAVRRYQLGKQ